MPENTNPRKRRRPAKEEPSDECVHTAAPESPISTAQVDTSTADILPAGTFYSQLIVKSVTEALRSHSPRVTQALASEEVLAVARPPCGLDRAHATAQRIVASSHALGDIIRERLLSTLGSIENLRVDHHVQITDENAGISSGDSSVGYPEFLLTYGNLILDQTRCLQKTCRVVLDAVRRIYQDELDSAAEFARLQVPCTLEKPCTPKMTSDELLAIAREDFDDTSQRMKAFSSLLPGFEMFDQDDQKAILATRYVERHLLHRAPRLRNGSVQYWVGPEKIHVCTPWLKLVDTKRNFVLADSVNRLELDHAESYLSFCLAFFRPGSDITVRDQDLLRFLYAHYLDVFHHLVSSRSRGSHGFYEQYQTVVSEMPSAYNPDNLKQRMQYRLRNSEPWKH